MKFKTNKIILFCNRRITPQIAQNWGNNEYLKDLLNTVLLQAENKELESIDFKNLINYVLYSLGNYYRGNTIFVFQLLVAFLYLITPVDIVSDFIPVIGYIDDLMLFTMILERYSNELETFNKVSRDMLDIKYMRVDPKVINEFTIKPHEAVDLIIKDRPLVEIDGEEIINNKVAEAEELDVEELINIDVIEVIKYELVNYLLKSKSGSEVIDEDLILSLIQIPDVITKKDVSYFLKNIDDILGYQPITVTQQKKGIFSLNSYELTFSPEELLISTQISFVQVECSYNNMRQQVIRYKAMLPYIDYKDIVEIIDLSRQKHTFDQTIIYFELVIDGKEVVFKVDKTLKIVGYVTATELSNVLNDQLSIIAKLIKERVM